MSSAYIIVTDPTDHWGMWTPDGDPHVVLPAIAYFFDAVIEFDGLVEPTVFDFKNAARDPDIDVPTPHPGHARDLAAHPVGYRYLVRLPGTRPTDAEMARWPVVRVYSRLPGSRTWTPIGQPLRGIAALRPDPTPAT